VKILPALSLSAWNCVDRPVGQKNFQIMIHDDLTGRRDLSRQYIYQLIVTLGDKPQLLRLHYPDREQSR
jgi:hypothetical protein